MPIENHIKIFIAYSREDTDILDELRKNLVVIERTQDVDVWYDGEIEVGTDWAASIKENLHSADIILLLISQNFIASDYCYDTEMTQALALHQTGKVKVIPVIGRECLWRDTPFSKLQALPPNGKAIMSKEWDNPNRPYFLVASELKELVNTIRISRVAPDAKPKPRTQINQPDPVVSNTASEKEGGFFQSLPFRIGLPLLLLFVIAFLVVPKFLKDDPVEEDKTSLQDETDFSGTVDDNGIVAENLSESDWAEKLFQDQMELGQDYFLKEEYNSAIDEFNVAVSIAAIYNLEKEKAEDWIERCKQENLKFQANLESEEKRKEYDKYKKEGDEAFENGKYDDALKSYNHAKDYKNNDEINSRIKKSRGKKHAGRNESSVDVKSIDGIDMKNAPNLNKVLQNPKLKTTELNLKPETIKKLQKLN